MFGPSYFIGIYNKMVSVQHKSNTDSHLAVDNFYKKLENIRSANFVGPILEKNIVLKK